VYLYPFRIFEPAEGIASTLAWHALAQCNISPLKTKRRLLYLKTQFVQRNKHFSTRL